MKSHGTNVIKQYFEASSIRRKTFTRMNFYQYRICAINSIADISTPGVGCLKVCASALH